MSSGREKHDGTFAGGNISFTERRNSFGSKSKNDQPSASEGSKRNSRFLIDYEESGEKESSSSDRYLITYADLITLLLGLFIILYAISNIDIKKYEEMMTAMGSIFGNSKGIPSLPELNPGEIYTKIDDLKSDLNTVIKRYKFESSVTLEENERGIVIHIVDDILFSSGEAILSESSKTVLHELSAILRQLPNDIRVEGHTDNIKIYSQVYPSNWHLSVARALNTAYYLIESENLSPDKVSIVGNSEYKPIAQNITPEGRAKNRRVDIVIIK